jgi:hypothetical protein
VRPLTIIGFLAVGVLLACGEEKSKSLPSESPTPEKTPPPAVKSEPAPQPKSGEAAPATAAAEPDYIKVQHILIGFKDAVGFEGSPPPGASKRTKDEAEKLAKDLLARARKGEDFDKLVKEFTDDQPPGIYGMANNGKPPKPDYRARKRMVAAFGDTGFPLQVGEIGMAVYDPAKSPFGWHIVKRVE